MASYSEVKKVGNVQAWGIDVETEFQTRHSGPDSTYPVTHVLLGGNVDEKTDLELLIPLPVLRQMLKLAE